MKTGFLLGMTMIALLDVVRVQFERAYAAPANISVEYVLLVCMGLLLFTLAFPDGDC